MALDLSGFKQTFNDDFTSFTSTPQGDGGWQSTINGARHLNNTGEQQYYSDSTVGVDPFSVHDGTLTITASPGSNPDGLAYNSGVISSLGDFSQEYGYFEMTAKLPEGAGMWPGFWLLQTDHSWPPELDAVEAFGATNSRGEGGADQAHINLISTVPDASQGNWVTVPGGDIYDQFHRYGVDWEPDTITYYIDGQEVGKIPTPADMHEPMYMVANLAVGGNWAENPNGETGSMVIDNIRAYSKDPSAVAVADPSTDSGIDATHATNTAPADGTSDASIMPPTGSASTDASAGAPPAGTDSTSTTSTSSGDPSAQTDATHAQTSDTSVADGSATDVPMDHAMGSPVISAAVTTGASASNTASNMAAMDHPGTAVADGGTGGTTDHGAAPADGTMLTSDTPANGTAPTDTPATDSSAMDTAHPGTAVADGSTGGTTADHAPASPDAATPASGTPTNGTVPTDTSPTDSSAMDTAPPGTAVADGSSSGTTADHTTGSVTGDASPQTTTSDTAADATAAPDASGGASAGAGLTLHVSADSWNGAPQFQVLVDGKQVGDVHTATADHGAGQWEDVTINGDFGSGAHVVDVNFLNDAWNRTADADRNLYVQSITMNGVTLAGNEAENNAHNGAWSADPSAAVMQVNGEAEFHVPQSTAGSDLWTS